MKLNHSILIMLHCEQDTGYAIGTLENIFFEATKAAGYDESQIYWSFKSITNTCNGRAIACDYYETSNHDNFIQFIESKGIEKILAFDLNYPSPVLDAIKKTRVTSIVAYWGASMSSINRGLKLLAKRCEWIIRSNKPNYFVFESEAMRLTATNGRGVPIQKTAVVPLGVDTLKFTPHYNQDFYAHNTLNISGDKKIVFYSGHMEERKGVRVIVNAAIHLIETIKNKDIHFVICGNKGNEADTYLKLLQTSEAKKHVTFAGYRTDIPALMRSSYLGVIASTGWDSFTMSSVEMMASGLPLIVSNLQGLAETIEDGINGYHIKPGDHVQLATLIDQLSKDSATATRFSQASRTRATTKFSKEEQINQMAQILTSQ